MASRDDEVRPRRSSDRSGERPAKRPRRDADEEPKARASRHEGKSLPQDRGTKEIRDRSSTTASRDHGPATLPATIASSALEHLALTGREPEGITAIHRTDDGWSIEVEVLELTRTPTTTDLLATYEIDLDAAGGFVRYHRSRRYVRGAPSA